MSWRGDNAAGVDAGVCFNVAEDEWRAFAESQPGYGVFHSPGWSRVLAECYGCQPLIAGLRDTRGVLVAGIPFMAMGGGIRKRRWVALPFTDHLEPLAVNSEALNALVAGLASASARDSVETVEIRWPSVPAPAGRIGAGYVHHVLPLQPDPDVVAAGFSKGHRGAIRKAERSAVVSRIATDLDALGVFYRLHVSTRRKLGVPVQPRRFFDLLWQHVICTGSGFIMLAEQHMVPVAAAIFLNSPRTLVYKFGASDPDRLECCPNNLLLSDVIRWACGEGFQTMDWGRTEFENEGLRRFKSRWGAIESSLDYSYLGRQPNVRGGGLVNRLAASAIKVAPEIVCRAVGEAFYRYAG